MVEYKRHHQKGIYPREEFEYDRLRDIYNCPEGKELKYWGIHKRSRQHVYRARTKDCSMCTKKQKCTRDRARSISYHIHEQAIQKAREFNKTREYRISQRMRRRIEELFGEAKEFMGMRRAKFRRQKFVREQVLMTAAAQNIKRMVKMLSREDSKGIAAAAQKPFYPAFLREFLEIFAWLSHKINKNLLDMKNCLVEI